MSSILSANRVAAIVAFLTGVASALAGIESALPSTAGNAVATAVGILGAIVTCLHFMLGSQKYDAAQAYVKVQSGPPSIPSIAEVSKEIEQIAEVAQQVQSTPGTVESEVQSGLSPTPAVSPPVTPPTP